MDFSHETIQYVVSLSGNSTSTIVSGASGYDVQIMAVSMQQEKDLSVTILMCGNDVVAKNYGKDLPQIFTHYHCDSEDFTLLKTGNDEATVHILYATSSQHEYTHEKNIANQLNGGETLFISAIILFFLSFIAWRYMFRLTAR